MATRARFDRVHEKCTMGSPGRSGPKRLGNGRCDVALATPSHEEASTAVPHPGWGGVFHTRQPRGGTRGQVRKRQPSSSTTLAQRA